MKKALATSSNWREERVQMRKKPAFQLNARLSDKKISILISALSLLIVSAITTSLFIGLAFAILSGVGANQFLKQRKENKYEQLTLIWPEVIDHLVSGLYSGLSITEALSELENRGPEIVQEDFAQFKRDIRAGVTFNDALNTLRDKFAHQGSDQIFEVMQLAKTLGGGELLNTLRTLGSFQREDLILNKEISIKHGWIRNSANISAAAPWLLLLMIGSQSGTAASFATPTGILILFSGVMMTFFAYLWMAKISKLPKSPRVFRG